mmetsp:Transcript_79180/g.256683  ORF Transcript_79180/g.256683 Transcript_79180/m.256683 type:complete len:326 (-) Transcript_79180:737-1714(-)
MRVQQALVNLDAVDLEQPVNRVVVGNVPWRVEHLVLQDSLVPHGPHVRAPEEDAVRPSRHPLGAVARPRDQQLERRRKLRTRAPEAHRLLPRHGLGVSMLARRSGRRYPGWLLQHLRQLVVLLEIRPLPGLDRAVDVLPEGGEALELRRLGQAHVGVPHKKDGAVGPQWVQELVRHPEVDVAAAELDLVQALLEVPLHPPLRGRGFRVEVAVDEAKTPVVQGKAAGHDALDTAADFVGGHLEHAELVNAAPDQLGQAEDTQQHPKQVNGLSVNHVQLGAMPMPRQISGRLAIRLASAAAAATSAVDGVSQELHPLHDCLRPPSVR